MSREELRREVDLGAMICTLIKQIYYADTPWPTCCMAVSDKLSAFINIMRKFYPDKTRMEILVEAQGYNANDIRDVFASIELYDTASGDKISHKNELVYRSEEITGEVVGL